MDEITKQLIAALQAILDEVSFGKTPYSADSYLPPHLVDAARDAVEKSNLTKGTT